MIHLMSVVVLFYTSETLWKRNIWGHQSIHYSEEILMLDWNLIVNISLGNVIESLSVHIRNFTIRTKSTKSVSWNRSHVVENFDRIRTPCKYEVKNLLKIFTEFSQINS